MNALQAVAICLGGFFTLLGLWILMSPEESQRFFRELPRNETIGRVLMFVDVFWSLRVFHPMNLGGWNSIKKYVYLLSPFIYWFIIRYVNSYLGARSIGLFLILLAKQLLLITFLRDEPSRLVITTLAYIWVVLGIIFFCAPYLMRDLTLLLQATSQRWKWTGKMNILAGCVLFALGIFAY
jgi:hypothetical protein